MAHQDNPAGRLQHLFEQAFAQPQDGSAKEGWCAIFDLVYPEDAPFLLERFGRMHEAARRARDLVESLVDDDPEVMLEHFGEIESVFTHVLALGNNKMSWVLSVLHGTGMQSLKMCSSLLHRRMPEPVLGDGERDRLQVQVHQLMGDVRGADDLDDDSRDAILDKLAEVGEALRNVDLDGSVPVRSSAESLIGSLLTQRGVWERASKSSVAQGLFGLLVLIDLMLNITANYREVEAPQQPSPMIVQIWTEGTGQRPPPLELPPPSTGDNEPDHDVGKQPSG